MNIFIHGGKNLAQVYQGKEFKPKFQNSIKI